jgi:hypothetical protein
MSPLCIGIEVIALGLRLCLGEPAPARVTVAVCPVIAPWSADYQRRLASELRALAPGSALEGAVAEAISLRDQARACRARAPASN